jgi:hypothetical protein
MGVAIDRTAVLFLGLGLGCMIGGSFSPAKVFDQHFQVAMTPTAAVASSAKPATVAKAVRLGHRPALIDAAIAAPPAGFTPRLPQTLARGEPITVGVFGDSFGDGVWAALYRRLPKVGDYKVVKFSQEATGFTRYDSLNVEDQTATQLAGEPVDIAVINFGANDTRGIVADGHVYPTFSPGWKAVYGKRVEGMVALLRAKGAMVYWMGLPRMRSPGFDADITAMNAFLAERMAALGVPYFDTLPLSVDPQGGFDAYLADSDAAGAPRRLMRANDGIHMTMNGYEHISLPLIARIKADVAQSKAALATPADPATPQAGDGDHVADSSAPAPKASRS